MGKWWQTQSSDQKLALPITVTDVRRNMANLTFLTKVENA